MKNFIRLFIIGVGAFFVSIVLLSEEPEKWLLYYNATESRYYYPDTGRFDRQNGTSGRCFKRTPVQNMTEQM